MAIRWAVGTARENDCVVIAGKGAEDFQEHWETGGFDEDGEFFEWEDENGELDDSVGEMIKVRPSALGGGGGGVLKVRRMPLSETCESDTHR